MYTEIKVPTKGYKYHFSRTGRVLDFHEISFHIIPVRITILPRLTTGNLSTSDETPLHEYSLCSVRDFDRFRSTKERPGESTDRSDSLTRVRIGDAINPRRRFTKTGINRKCYDPILNIGNSVTVP